MEPLVHVRADYGFKILMSLFKTAAFVYRIYAEGPKVPQHAGNVGLAYYES